MRQRASQILPLDAFVTLPPGSFRRRTETAALQEVTLTRPLCWQATPVTVGLYRRYLADTRSDDDPQLEVWDGQWRPGPSFTEANRHGLDIPVVGVSHRDAAHFLAWLRDRDRRGYRLPTEAEFEYAARGGCSCALTCHGHVLPRRRPPRAWPDGLLQCWAEATRQPNAYGIYGLAGVLWHWCSDWYAPYPGMPHVIDPSGPETPPENSEWKGRILPAGRVIRGGSFSYPEHYGHCTNRHFSFENDRNVNLGFRVVFESDH